MNGGSNYICTTGTVVDSPLFGVFHQNRDVVTSQLQTMFSNGQKMITFVLWYADTTALGHPEGRWAHMLNSHTGDLEAQYKQNVVDVLSLAQQTGFTEIHFRFAEQGNALPEPDGWGATWNAAQFQQNLSFTMNVRNLVASNVSVRTLFDLSLESISPNYDYMRYCTELWRNYVAQVGSSDASFSINTGHRPSTAKSCVRLMVNTFNNQGLPLPTFIMADCYSNEYLTLKGLHDGMVSVGQGNLPVYLQETYYNDSTTAAEVKKVKAIPGLKLKGIFQWPWARGNLTPNENFAPVFPKAFRKYSMV